MIAAHSFRWRDAQYSFGFAVILSEAKDLSCGLAAFAFALPEAAMTRVVAYEFIC